MVKEEFLKNFGQHIKSLRKEKGITAAELGRRTEIERFHISRLESGKINPTLVTIKSLASGFDMELDEFFKGFKKD